MDSNSVDSYLIRIRSHLQVLVRFGFDFLRFAAALVYNTIWLLRQSKLAPNYRRGGGKNMKHSHETLFAIFMLSKNMTWMDGATML